MGHYSRIVSVIGWRSASVFDRQGIRRNGSIIQIQNALLLAVPALNQLSHNFLLESHKVYCRLLQSTANLGTFLGKSHEQLVD